MAERRHLELVDPEPRPRKRRDCEPCATCQAWRDAGAPSFGGQLSCGHDAGGAVMRSRPCLFVGCHHHLFLDVQPQTGVLKLNFPDLEPDQMVDSCVLDVVVDACETTLDVVGEKLGLTRERARQIEEGCMALLRRHVRPEGFRQLVRDEALPVVEVALPSAPISLRPELEVAEPIVTRAQVRARLSAARDAAAAMLRPAAVVLAGIVRAARRRVSVLARWAA